MAKFSERHNLQGSGGTSFTQRRSLGITPTMPTRQTPVKQSQTEELYRRADAAAAPDVGKYLQDYYNALDTHYNNVVSNGGEKVAKHNGIAESSRALEEYQRQSGDIINTIRNAYGADETLIGAVRDLNRSYAQLDNAVYNSASQRARQEIADIGNNATAAQRATSRANRGERLTLEDISALDTQISNELGITQNAPQSEGFVVNPLSGRSGILEAARQIRDEDDRTPLDRMNGETLDTSGMTDQTIPGFQTVDERFGNSNVTRDISISNLPLVAAESGIRSEAELSMTPEEMDNARSLFATMDSVYRNENATNDELNFQSDIARGIARNSSNSEAIQNMAQEYYQLLQNRISETSGAEYLTNRFADAFVDWRNNYDTLASQGLGDIATGGSFSEGYKKLTDFAASHPATYRRAMEEHFGEGQNSGVRRELAEAAGVTVAVVDSWLKANEASYLELRADERASGLSDEFKKYIGDTVYHTASQIPTWVLSAALGGWGVASSMPGSVVEGLATGIQNARQATSFAGAARAFGTSFGQGLLAAAKADPALWFSFGIGTMGRTTAQNAMQRGYDPVNYLNGALMGFSEVFSENFSGFGSAKNPFTSLGTTYGSRFLTTLSAIGSYLLSGAEEGLEEVVNVPLQNFIDMSTLGENKKLVGTGGIFDFAAMWEAGMSGAAMGALLGSVGTLANIASDLTLGSKVTGSSGWLRNAAQELNAQSVGMGLTPLNINTVTVDDIERREAEVASKLIQTANEAVGNSYLRNGTTEELYAMGERLGGAVADQVAVAREAGDSVSPAVVGSIASAVRAEAARMVNEEVARVAGTDVDGMSEEARDAFLTQAADNVESYAQMVRDLDEKVRDEDERVADIYGRSMAPAAKEQMQKAWDLQRSKLSEEDLKMEDAVAQDFMSRYNAAYQYGKALGDTSVGKTRLASLGDEQFLTDAYNLGVGFAERPTAGNVVARGNFDGAVRNISQRELSAWSAKYHITEVGQLSERQLAEKAAMDVFAKSLGTNIVVYRSLDNTAPNGWYDHETGTIYVDVNAGAGTFSKASMLRTLSHELTHMIQQKAPKEYAALKDFVITQYYHGKQSEFDARVNEEIEASGGTLSPERAVDEVVANACEMMLRDTDAIRRISIENKPLAQRIADFLAKFVQAIKDMLNAGFKNIGISEQAASDMEEHFAEMQKLWDDGLVEASKWSVSPYLTDAEVDQRVDDGEEILPDQETDYSRRKDSQFMDNAENWLADAKKNESPHGDVTKEALAQVRQVREMIRKFMDENEEKLKLPLDNDGNTFLEDSSYVGSEENTTVCPRSLAAQKLMDLVSDELGRPLTVADTLVISQELLGISIKPECVYCYVAADRRAYRDFLGEYINQRDAALVDVADGMDKDEAYTKFRHGRANTDNMKRRWRLWMNLSTDQMIGKKDLANFARLEDEYAELYAKVVRKSEKFADQYDAFLDKLEAGTATDDEIRYWQLYDSRSYSKSASWAKNQYGYTAYNGHILEWSDDMIKDLNSKYGLRMYSFSDFSPAFILENMQMITDAAVRGLKVLAYTKETDFAKIFAPSGAYIEISVYATEMNGQVMEDEMMGANWAEARELRKQYGNVGITLVATNDRIVEWGLNNPDVDVVIPYHLVRTGKEIAEHFNFHDYTQESRDRRLEKVEWYDKKYGKGEGQSIHPGEHKNDIVLYVKALQEHHLAPRFERYIYGWKEFLSGKISETEFRNHPMNKVYMKLVNETRNVQKPVQPIFPDSGENNAVDTAMNALKYLRDHGGYGIDETVVGGIGTLERESHVVTAKILGETDEEKLDEIRDRYVQESSRKRVIGNTDILVSLVNKGDLTTEQIKALGLIKKDVTAVNNDRAEIESINRRLAEVRAEERAKNHAHLSTRAAKQMDRLMLRRIELHDHIDMVLDRIDSRMEKSGLDRYAKSERAKIEGMVSKNLAEAVQYINSKYNKELAAAYQDIADTRQSFVEYIAMRDEMENRASLRKTTRKLVKRLAEQLTTNNDKLHVPEPLKVPVATFLMQIDPTTAKPGTKHGDDQVARWQESIKQIGAIAKEAAAGSFDDGNALPIGMFAPDVGEYVDALEKDVSSVIRSFSGLDTEEDRITNALARQERKESLVRGDRRGAAAIRAEESAEILGDELGGVQKIILNMNAVQLAHLNRVIRAVQRAVTNANRVYAQGRKMRLSDMAESTIEYLDTIKGDPFLIHEKEDSGSKAVGAANRLERFFAWANCTPAYAFSRCGEMAEELFFSLARGQAEFAKHADEIMKFCESQYTTDEAKKWSERKHEFELTDTEGKTRTVKLSMWQIMSLWCHMNQQDSVNYIYGSQGIQIATEEGQKPDLHHYPLTPEQVGKILNTMGPKDSHEHQVAKAMQDFMTKYGADWGNKVTMAMWNYKFFAETQPYMQIQVHTLGKDAIKLEEKRSSLLGLLHMSATKQRTHGKNQALVIEGLDTVFNYHMADMATYTSYALPIVDVVNWLNYNDDEASVQKSLSSAFGQVGSGDKKTSVAVSYFVQLIKDLNGTTENGGQLENLAGKMLSFFKRVAVGANIRVAAQQPLSYTRAAYVIPVKYLNLKYTAARLKANAQEAIEHSGTALWKSLGYFDTAIARPIEEQMKNEMSLGDKLVEKSMWLAEQGDKVTWGALWAACKLKVQDEHKDWKSLDEQDYWDLVNKEFDRVIYFTQVMDCKLMRSEIMRGHGLYAKIHTAFMAEPTLTLNMLMDGFFNYRTVARQGGDLSKARRRVALAVGTFTAVSLMNALVTALMDAFRDDDDYETFLEKFIDKVGKNFLENINPFDNIPLVKDIIELIKSTVKGQNYTPTEMTGIVNAIKAIMIWAETVKVANGGKPTATTYYGKMGVYGKIYITLQALSQFCGLPISNVVREGVSFYNGAATIWNSVVGRFQNEYAPHVRSYVSNTGGYDNLFYATTHGNPQRAQQLYDELIGHGVSEEDIMKEMRSRVQTAYTDGDITKPTALRVLQQYGYSSDDAYSMVDKWDFQMQYHIDGASEAMTRNYNATFKPLGVPAPSFAEWWGYLQNCETQKDADGNVTASVKNQRRDYIERLQVTESVRSALWDLFYDSEW